VAWVINMLGLHVSTGLAALVAYVTLCRGFRYWRRDQKHVQFSYKTREDFKKMTAEDAFQIMKYVYSLEFPFVAGKALAFALFR
jgi:hypothetical protein